MLVNHERVSRIMRDDNLLLTGLNQLWLADITYIRLQKELST
jgi:hypothetical protein